jgi:hypothetical protein
VNQQQRLGKTLLSLASAMTGAAALLGWLDPSPRASSVATASDPAAAEWFPPDETIAAADRNHDHDDAVDSLPFSASFLIATRRQSFTSSSGVPMVLASQVFPQAERRAVQTNDGMVGSKSPDELKGSYSAMVEPSQSGRADRQPSRSTGVGVPAELVSRTLDVAASEASAQSPDLPSHSFLVGGNVTR